MSKSRGPEPDRKKLLTLAAGAFEQAARRLTDKDAVAGFRAAGDVLDDLARKIGAADASAHSRFPEDLARGCKWVARGLGILGEAKDPYPELTALRAFPHAADGLALLASSLRQGAASLEPLEQEKGHKTGSDEVGVDALAGRMEQLAKELSFTASAYHRVFRPEAGEATAESWSAEFLEAEAKLLASVYVESASPLVVFSRLLVAKADLFRQPLAGLFLSIAAFLSVAVMSYIPWYCDQDCIGDGQVVGVSLSRTTSRRSNRVDPFWAQGGTPGLLLGALVGDFVAIQPQIYINWEICCYNWCVLLWNDQFIKTVETGPHDIGAPISNRDDADATARQRATTAAMMAFPRPAAPC